MMEHENEVYKGYLLLPPSSKLLIKKTWQQKYCYLFKASKFGIERLEIWDCPDKTKGPPPRIITLENCIKITCDGDTHFSILTKTSPLPHEFSALCPSERNDWLSALRSVAFPDDLSTRTSIEEDNDLYCPSGEGVFNVRVKPSVASERCGLSAGATYTLVLTSTAMQLKRPQDGAVLYTWPYCFIRRYGYKGGRFTFEAGRKCDSGEGTFFLEHTNQQEIFRCLASKMKSMKKLLKEDPNPLLPILDCGDNQFHAALSMEARSRSPLPPSPTASTSLHDVDTSIRSNQEVVDVKKEPIRREKPTKPPRKSLQNKQSTTYEPVDKYDKIEYRNDAWKTMGVDEISHTEKRMSTEETEEEYFSWGDQKVVREAVPVVPIAPKVITTKPPNQNTPDANYDTLNFFGSSNKLNSGYKQVAVLTSGTSNPSSYYPSFNDYDEVQPAMEEVRLADDSHLGYALVRKNSGGNKMKDVDHQFHNNEPYAVISKPKRV